ncbi:MAG: phosphomevalonate kinase [Peltula sp. TS41687]|nr:MAG: phosphomevalonate kinase [Peltula sp. TS41687]
MADLQDQSRMDVMSRPLAVSAPGKVLLAGGYLVLERRYTGLVFALDARIHVLVQAPSDDDTRFHPPIWRPWDESDTYCTLIIVRSPQFTGAQWCYAFRAIEEGKGVKVEDLEDPWIAVDTRNKFLETALGYALSYVSSRIGSDIKPALITILADSDYYSHEVSSADDKGASAAQSRFIDFGVKLQQANKTGLGSSAALVTAFIAALLSFYLPREIFDISNDQGRARAHKLAQIAHSEAQGKIGSGFDVAAAVYGSCMYRRFSPSIFEGLGRPGDFNFAELLRCQVENPDGSNRWDYYINMGAVKWPSQVRLVLCDVDCGTATVGMAKKVLAWRAKNREEADVIWNRLQGETGGLSQLLTNLAGLENTIARASDQRLVTSTDRDDPEMPVRTIEGALNAVRETISEIRKLIQEMSTKADVPIEPPSQTKLLDFCTAIPGVLGGVVPGAGGYDAVALLVMNKDDVLDRLRMKLKDWEAISKEGNDEKPVRVRMLGVREDLDGVRVEAEEDYGAWLQ